MYRKLSDLKEVTFIHLERWTCCVSAALDFSKHRNLGLPAQEAF